MYTIIAENRVYRTKSAKNAADVAVTWKKQGYAPKAWCITDSADGIKTTEIKITSKDATAKSLAAA